MPYYHVLVATTASPQKLECILWDQDRKSLRKRFIKPLSRSRDIVVDGRIVRRSEIAVVRIQQTDESADPLLKKLQETSWAEIERFNRESPGVAIISAGDGHSRDDLHMVGTDVTSRFLAADLSPTWLGGGFWNNPWLVTVGGGLLVIGLAALLAHLF